MGLFSKKTTIPATGFYSQPGSYQSLYNQGLLAARQAVYDLNTGKINTDQYTPIPQTSDETRAFDIARRGMAPTPESLNSDILMLMNPYDDYVISDLNRQAAGENSLVNQLASRAGQIGSNRSFLGTSDVEQNRLNNIGRLRQGQYNTAISQALNNLPALRQQDIANLMNIGGFQRNLDLQTKQAPLVAAQNALGLLGSVPTQFGNFGSEERTVKGPNALGSVVGALAPVVGSALGPIGAAVGGAFGGYAGSGGKLSGALAGLGQSAITSGFSGGFGFGGGGGDFSRGGLFSNPSPMTTSQWDRMLASM